MDGFVEKKLKVREYLQRFSLFLYKVEEFHKLKKLNDQEYHHLLSLSPFDSCSLNNEYLQSYVLLPFEQEFLKVNCTRNANNEIIDMQPWYVDYIDKLVLVKEDVRRAGYLEILNLEEKKEFLDTLLDQDFNKGIMSIEEYQYRKREIEHLNDTELLQKLFNYYQIDMTNYKWFIELDAMKKAQDSHFVQESLIKYSSNMKTTIDLEKKQKLYKKLVEEADNLQEQITTLFGLVSKFDTVELEAFYKKVRSDLNNEKSLLKSNFLGKYLNATSLHKGSMNEYQKELYNIFVNLVKNSSLFVKALQEYIGYEEKDLSKCYENYFEKTYGENVHIVRPTVFVNDLFSLGLDYYGDEYTKNQEQRQNVEKQIKSLIEFKKGSEQEVDYIIKMWSRIHEVKTDSERTKLYFYQKSDEEALYSDIVELLNNDLIEKKNTLKESKLKP